MLLLLDTCCLLWLVADQSGLSGKARQLIARHAGSLYVSAISAFEIALKCQKGRLALPLDPEVWIERALAAHGVLDLPVTARIAARAAMLPPLHADPCDRIVIATAQFHGAVILTPDPLIHAYPGVQVRW